MRVITFNANGIRAAARNGFYRWLQEQEFDFLCLQETKANMAAYRGMEPYYLPFYYCDYADAEKKGYSGVGICARFQPLNIIKSVNFAYSDQEGRYIQFDYHNFSIISVYFPSGTSGDLRQSVKYDFLAHFAEHLINLKNSGKELIICGDYNIAHQKIDLENWRGNQKNSGFLPMERAWMDKLFNEAGFIDSFRSMVKEAGHYTWWSYRHRQAFSKNVGWRIDYQVVTPNLANHIKNVEIYREQRFSDHAPLIVDYEGLRC